MIADRIEALLADKGYDADAIREDLAAADIEAVIPAKSNRRNPVPHDREKYRGAISWGFCSTSSRTGAELPPATTKPEIYTGFVNLVAVLQWIPFVHETWRATFETPGAVDPAGYRPTRSIGLETPVDRALSDSVFRLSIAAQN